jgi:hypothetical protein
MTSDHSHDRDTAFDEAARRAHDAALAQLSPRVRAQLAQRRRAALAGPREAGFKVWPMLALGSTAAVALAVGLFVLRGADDAGLSASQPAVAVERPDSAADDTIADGSAPTTAPSVAHTPAPQIAATTVATDRRDIVDPGIDPAVATSDVVDVDSLPDEWLAAELEAGDAALGLDTFEENPDFYLWLAANEGQADVTESL